MPLSSTLQMPNVTVECCLDIIDKFENSEENKQKGILGIEGEIGLNNFPHFNCLHLSPPKMDNNTIKNNAGVKHVSV